MANEYELNSTTINGATGPVSTPFFDIQETASAAGTTDTMWSVRELLRAVGVHDLQTFYNPQVSHVLAGVASLRAVAAWVEALSLAGSAQVDDELTAVASQWLSARGSGTLQTGLQLAFEAMLTALLGGSAQEAFATLVAEVGSAADSRTSAEALQIVDGMAAALIPQATMLLAVSETLAAEAGDEAQVLGHYTQEVKDLAGSWLVFKVSGEVVQGWVMNVEGERPFSAYEGFDFNSMARIGRNYFAASDEGLHMLGGDTDAGAQIDARVSSMMLDFDTTAQKRVVAAYLGYTSDGVVMLKVRSVDQGRLVEHWYTATDVTADAPRAGYRPLGRGLKSRYWQFEIANVDGADFEVDKLELQPIKLSRRV